ncbi:hypothetical protein P4E94_11070 [Pontiellaceae bacterium B12219]|nr:hypothetical protein [Pontiellaceae bacterium B12219]
MKKRIKNSKNISKGAPSGFMISLLVHAGAFLLAGMLVVFTVTQKEEKKFVPPTPVNRPKMKLKKPKVSVKKNAKPKSSSRIVTKVTRANMPDIQLPEMAGMGEGLIGGVESGFDIMPELETINALGSGSSIGNDFEGTYYDLKFSRSGVYNPISEDEWRDYFYKLFRGEWDTRILSRFYRSPKTLYTTCFVLPHVPSALAPVAFGLPDSMASGGEWIVHYKGDLVYKEDITFRFWASSDDSLAVKVDGEVVIADSWQNITGEATRAALMYGGLWKSSSMDTGKYWIGHGNATVGDWITLKAGVPKKMEVIATDNPSPNASFYLLVEVKGVEYPRGRHNGPLLPIFKTEELSHDHLDLIYRSVPEDVIDCVNGPIFRDY